MKKTENLIDTIEATKVPTKYELRASDLDIIYDKAHDDIFQAITWAFAIGFNRGQKASVEGVMTDIDDMKGGKQ